MLQEPPKTKDLTEPQKVLTSQMPLFR